MSHLGTTISSQLFDSSVTVSEFLFGRAPRPCPETNAMGFREYHIPCLVPATDFFLKPNRFNSLADILSTNSLLAVSLPTELLVALPFAQDSLPQEPDKLVANKISTHGLVTTIPVMKEVVYHYMCSVSRSARQRRSDYVLPNRP